MVEIKITLDGQETSEQKNALLTLLGMVQLCEPKTNASVEGSAKPIVGKQDATEAPVKEQKPKTGRKRRTRAEIEADTARKAPAGNEIDEVDDQDDDTDFPLDDDDQEEMFDIAIDEGEDDELDTDDPKHMARLIDLISEVRTDSASKAKIKTIMEKKVKATSTKNLTDKQKKILYAELLKLKN